MAVEGFQPFTLEDFSGLHTYEGVEQKVPVGRATSCLNVEFSPTRVFTRAGLTQVADVGSANIMSIREFVQLDGTRNTLALGSDGSLYSENGSFSYFNIASNITEASVAASTRMNACTLFGKEFMGFTQDSKTGVALPRQYDGTNFDPVAPGGPGIAPIVTPGGASSGSISAGTHKFRVFYKTRTGYWTAPGPANSIIFSGDQNATLSGIATGPPWVTARVIAVTPSCSDNYYFIAGTSMEINDNITTDGVILDFDDATLIAGTAVSSLTDPTDDLLQQVQLGAMAGSVSYHGRVFWWGERNVLGMAGDNGFRALRFDGGFTGNQPNGWTEKVSGESQGTGDPATFGDFLVITGDGTHQKGCLENTGNASLLPAGVTLNVRIRAKKSAGCAAGSIHVYLCASGSAASTLPGSAVFVCDQSQLSSTEWRVIDAKMIDASNNRMDPTWVLRVSSGGSGFGGVAITNGQTISIDYIEPYLASDPHSRSTLKVSKTDDPEAVDGLTGLVNVAEGNGQAIVGAFVLRDNLYVTKEHSIYTVYDPGGVEPDEWPVQEVSATVGALSSRAVSVAEGFAVIADRAGLYFFSGGAPEKIVEEIQPTWNTVNCNPAAAPSVWVLADVVRKRIMAGVPTGSNTSPDTVFSFEWVGDYLTGYMSDPNNRDFCPWTFPTPITSACFSERSDGTRQTIFGTGDGSGRIGKLDDSVRGNDLGQACQSYYRTAYFGYNVRELAGYLRIAGYGNGNLDVRIYSPDEVTFRQLTSYPLASSPPNKDFEWMLKDRGERLACQFGTSQLNEWFTVYRLEMFAATKPAAPVRGGLNI